MAHFAEINSDNNEVLRVIVVSNDQCTAHGGQDSSECEQWVKEFHPNDPTIDYSGISNTYWKRTSYWTRAGVHYQLDNTTPSEDQTKAFRGNFAGRGGTYDSANNVFWHPQPYSSWTKNNSTWSWEAPVAFPSVVTYGDGVYYHIVWDEDNLRWLGYDSADPSNEFAWDPDSSSWSATGN